MSHFKKIEEIIGSDRMFVHYYCEPHALSIVVRDAAYGPMLMSCSVSLIDSSMTFDYAEHLDPQLRALWPQMNLTKKAAAELRCVLNDTYRDALEGVYRGVFTHDEVYGLEFFHADLDDDIC